jgi:hypothetical protein
MALCLAEAYDDGRGRAQRRPCRAGANGDEACSSHRRPRIPRLFKDPIEYDL